MKTREIRIPEL